MVQSRHCPVATGRPSRATTAIRENPGLEAPRIEYPPARSHINFMPYNPNQESSK